MTRIRPITLDDAEALYAIRSRNGLGQFDPAEWRKWCLSCPFRDHFESVPLGWILESDGVGVGSFSNVHMLYDFNGKLLRAAIGEAWAVDPEYRNSSLKLYYASFRQPGVDLLIYASPTEGVARLHTAMKVDHIPSPDYDIPILWPLHHHAFATAALRQRAIPAADALAWPLGAGLRIADWMRSRGRARPSGRVRRIERFDDRFDSLWQKIRSGPPRLRAVRTSAVLQWRFQKDLNKQSATLLIRERGGELDGYAILLHNFRGHTGLKACDLGDLQAIDDDPEALKDLLLSALHVARDEGADALKFLAGRGTKRSVALSLRPFTYQYPFWQLFYKVRNASMAGRLAAADVWDFSLFDTF